jgi:hypothetical protein
VSSCLFVKQELVEKFTLSVADHAEYIDAHRKATDWLKTSDQRLTKILGDGTDGIETVQRQVNVIKVPNFITHGQYTDSFLADWFSSFTIM